MGNNLLNLVRAIVMPAVTISGFATLIYMLLTGQGDHIPNWFQVAVVGNTAWWFASAKNANGATP